MCACGLNNSVAAQATTNMPLGVQAFDVDSMPSPQDLDRDARRFQRIILRMQKDYKGKSGRHCKSNTARRRHITSVGMPNLVVGMLPTAQVWGMLDPPAEVDMCAAHLDVAQRASLDNWVDRLTAAGSPSGKVRVTLA